jgi:quinohemoprotein ethanol dehydrogenase
VPAKVFVAIALLLTTLAACTRSTPRVVDTARITAADTEPGNWLTHGRTYSEQRFSPLRAIDAGSVARLGGVGDGDRRPVAGLHDHRRTASG